MPTDRAQIESTLRTLEAQLAESADIDPQVKQRLAAMQSEILSSLQQPQSPPAVSAKSASISGGHSSLARRLADSAMYLEESHPQLSTTIGSLAGILGQMGL